MDSQEGLDQAKVEAFNQKANNDISGGYIAAMCSLGDELGLFRVLAERGPSTSAELAARAEVNERYAREWLAALTCAGYLERNPGDGRFTLPPEHVPTLAEEGSLTFLGGGYQFFMALLSMRDRVAEVFRNGGGVAQSAYPWSFNAALERMGTPGTEKLLVTQHIPAIPEVQTKLEEGVIVADIGCGNGRTLVKLAQTYPKSRFVGYDIYGPAIARATANAEAAGVADRLRFAQHDAAHGLPEPYDVIITMDVIHDSADPLGLLRMILRGLKPGGIYVLMEPPVLPTLEENARAGGAFYYSVSVLYCMTTSLAQGGAGLGTCGLPEPKLRELCSEAGFGSVRRLPFEDTAVYEVKP
jgi:SAM-dependent methyltransferase